MFDIGFSEIAVIGVVALVVLGPERLPKVARTAGHLFGRLQRYVANVKSDINREMELSELAKMKEEVTSAAKSFEQTINEQARSVETEAHALEKSATSEPPAPNPIPTPPASTPSQAELLAGQEAGLPPAIVTTPHPAIPAAPAAMVAPAVAATQTFDLGVEPPRRLRS